MIKNGADINYVDFWNSSALMHASRHGNIEMVEFLIAKGADVNIKNQYGLSALKMVKDEETQKAIIRAIKRREMSLGIIKIKKYFGINSKN